MKKVCNQKTIKEIEIISLVLSLIILGVFIYSLFNIGDIENTLKEEIYTYGLPGLFLVSIFLDLVPQFFSPFIVLATAIIAGLNVNLAIFIVASGSTVGATIGFILGKKYMFSLVDCLIKPEKTVKMTRMINKHGKWIVPVTAISPLPYVPLVIGALNFSKKNFIIYGLIPRIIGLTIFGYLINLI